MLSLNFDRTFGRGGTLLALGAHSDDIEIGCGGTILTLLRRYAKLRVWWVVLGASGPRAAEAEASAREFLRGAGAGRVIVKGFRDGFLPYTGVEVKEFFEELKREVSPDLILTHQLHDRHQDHRLACDLTWNTFRDHLILEYEVPKYDGDLGQPNTFAPLPAATARHKVDALVASYPSQAARRWFAPDLFLALLRLRGMECNAPSGLAEAFHGRKLRLLGDQP
jgi:LmbE family N-acetylglucosaminyl deacetylase